MNMIDLSGVLTNGGMGQTANTAANAGLFRINYATYYQSDLYAQLSNYAADEAMRFGLDGYEATARVAAELADAYAELSAMYLHAEKMNGRVAA